MSLGEGFGVGFRWVVGGCFPVKSERRGVGVGEGAGKGTGNRINAQALSKLPFSNLPFSLVIFFSLTEAPLLGRTRRGSYSPKRRVSAFYVPSRQPLLRTPSKNPS